MRSLNQWILSIALVFVCLPAFYGQPTLVESTRIRSIDKVVGQAQRGELKGIRPSFIEVNVDAFSENIRHVKEILGTNTKLCAVMKSNAYGHGLDNLMDAAIEAKPAYIALVENNEIAVVVKHLRASGKNIPIIRIAPATLEEAVEAIVKQWNVEELVGSVEQAKMLSTISERLSKTMGTKPIGIHININTGMGRMGVQNAHDVKAILSLPGLELKGIMTHFAQSDNMADGGEAMTRAQFEKYEKIVKQTGIGPNIVHHTANSAATSRFPWSRLDMVRVGSLLYGDVTKDTDPEGVLQHVMKSYKSSVALIMHDVPPSTPVGYDSEYRTPATGPSTLATVNVGYNNGYPRYAHRNGTEVLISGRRYPIVGKISMNLLVANITSQDTAHPIHIGDEVVLLGKQGNEEITMDELASRNKTSTYELLLRLGNNNATKAVRR